MATYSKGTVNAITPYTSTGATTSGNASIFQASSTANVITKLSGYVGISASTGTLAIGPTSLGNPSTVNGTLSIHGGGGGGGQVNYRINGTTFAVPGTSAVNTIYPRINFTLETSGSTSGFAMIYFDEFIITPGYYVYLYSVAGGSYTYAYELKKIEVTQR